MSRNKERGMHKVAEILRSAGIRPTAQRIAIAQYVLREADHPTAEDVKAHLDRVFPMVSTATVYNTLNALVEHGLIRAIKFPHADAAIYDQKMHHHYHFLDEPSGRLYDVDPADVQVKPQLGATCEITEVDVLIRGRLIDPGLSGPSTTVSPT